MRWALLLAVLSAVLFPAPANAARVEVGDHVPGVLPALFVLDPGHFDGGAEDEVNDVTLTLAADGRVEITDGASPVDARNGCESIDEHRARCPAAGIASISVQLGALDDSYRGGLPAGFYVSVYTGTGDDTLIGGPANEILDGGPGAEEIRGGDGNDSHNATVLFDAPNVGARITLDGLPDDGLPGEGDNVFPDVEDIGGTPGPDTIIATAGHNTITGGGGDDVLQAWAATTASTARERCREVPATTTCAPPATAASTRFCAAAGRTGQRSMRPISSRPTAARATCRACPSATWPSRSP